MARELEIVITANTQQADPALERTEQKLKGVEQAAAGADKAIDNTGDAAKKAAGPINDLASAKESLISKMKALAAPAVGLAVAKVLFDIQRAAGEVAVNLERMSKSSGFSPERVQQLARVYAPLGVSFDQIATASGNLAAKVGGGDKGAVGALKELGLRVEDIERMAPDARFLAIAKAMDSIPEPTRRAHLAVKLFGETGIKLLPELNAAMAAQIGQVPAFSDVWVTEMASIRRAFDDALKSGKEWAMWMATMPVELIGRAREIGSWMRGGDVGNRPNLPNIPPPVNGALPVPGLPANMGSIERELSAAVRDNTRATDRNSAALGVTGPLASTSLIDPRNLANYNGSGFGMFRPPVGMVRPDTTLDATFNENWVPFREAVAPNMPGAAAGGNWFTNLFKGKAGNIAGGVLGMLPGLIPGLSGRGASVGGSAGSLIGSIVGGPLAPILGPIGGFLGGAIGKLFGKGEHAKVNDQRDEFVSAAGGIHELNRKAQEAGLTLDRLLSAKKVKDFQSAVEELNGAFEDQAADQQRLLAAMDKYGLSIKDMGQQFKQTETNKGFKELGEDFRVLIGAGAEFNKVAEKMAPEFGALIHTAIETGTTVPRELEPILKKMIEMGTLTDKNGDKFTDLAQIPFAESMTAGFEKVVKAIEKLSAAIQGVAGDFDAAAGAANGLADAAGNIPAPGSGNPGGDNSGAVQVSRGGLIQGRGRVLYFRAGGEVPDLFRPLGTDTVPAMLTPGEVVLSRGMVRDLSPVMPSIIDGSLADIIRDAGGLVGNKGESSGPEVRTAPRIAPDAPRTQPVPFPRQSGGDVVVLSVPAGIDADGIADMVEKRLGRSLPGNRNRLRDVFDQLYERKTRRSA
jgi:hypothetical protein